MSGIATLVFGVVRPCGGVSRGLVEEVDTHGGTLTQRVVTVNRGGAVVFYDPSVYPSCLDRPVRPRSMLRHQNSHAPLPCLQALQVRQLPTCAPTPTRWPISKPLTFLPSSTTLPMTSCPVTTNLVHHGPQPPEIVWWSLRVSTTGAPRVLGRLTEPQTPQHSTATVTRSPSRASRG